MFAKITNEHLHGSSRVHLKYWVPLSLQVGWFSTFLASQENRNVAENHGVSV